MLDCGDPVHFHIDSLGVNNKPQKIDFRNYNVELLGFAIEAEFLNSVMHLAHMVLMLLLVCQTDEYDVKVASRKSSTYCKGA